ncbi:MAG TPA: ABC transporter substrate-binding protein [Morganella sp. (in: Bacteria)]|nr:ABC transporter substrate-binding protein [Morganella sp. (in: enterobacteria)]
MMKKLLLGTFIVSALFSLPAHAAPVQFDASLDGSEYHFKLDKHPQRIVSLSQITTEMLLVLGLGDRMVGTAFLEEPIYPPVKEAYDKIPVLAEKWPSYEVFMSVSPDFSTGWANSYSKLALEANKIVPEGVSVYIPESMTSSSADVNTYFNDLLKFGEIFDVEENAQKYVASEKEKLKSVVSHINKYPEKTAFIFDSQDGKPYTFFEGYTTEMLKLISVKNIFAGKGIKKTWAVGNWEDVIMSDPEVIIIPVYKGFRNDDDYDQKVAFLESMPEMQGVSAIKNKNYIKVNLSELVPGPRSIDILPALAKEIHEKH